MPKLIDRFPHANCIEQRPAVRRKLLNWFAAKQRDLPWRRNKSRYRIWVSEIMLQQTQVATVIDYYRRFMKRFPSIKSLAYADLDDVLRQWEGLGYYRRARQMHAAANAIMESYGGRFPNNYEEVIRLPGIGRYTAGAILSIADDQRFPILEGNTIRLYSRLLLMDSDPRSKENQKSLWEFAETILPRKHTGDFNQALMELGALVCTPTSPDCEHCPLQTHCPTFAQNKQRLIPAPSKKTNYLKTTEAVILVTRNNRFLIRKCLPGERWAGLWDFPRYSVEGNATDPHNRLQQQLFEDYGLVTTIRTLNHRIRHAVTRFRITLDCYETTSLQGRLKTRGQEMRWLSPQQIHSMPMSITGRKIADRLLHS